MSRWKVLEKVSPSGRTMFECSLCGRESYAPDKACVAGCSEPAKEPRQRTWEIDPGPKHEPRANGCACQLEIGDSPCDVHPTCEECGEGHNVHTRGCSKYGMEGAK